MFVLNIKKQEYRKERREYRPNVSILYSFFSYHKKNEFKLK